MQELLSASVLQIFTQEFVGAEQKYPAAQGHASPPRWVPGVTQPVVPSLSTMVQAVSFGQH